MSKKIVCENYLKERITFVTLVDKSKSVGNALWIVSFTSDISCWKPTPIPFAKFTPISSLNTLDGELMDYMRY